MRVDREKVDPDNIFPFDVPISFGEETQPLEVSFAMPEIIGST